MALTLAQAAYLSNDILKKGIIELIVKDDPILDKLQFKDVIGNGLTYNVETTLSTVNFYDVGDTWVEATSVTTPTTVTTKILGGDADVDNFLIATRSDVNDLMKEQIAAKTRAMKQKFLDTFWYGNTTYSSKEFNGMHTLISDATYNTVALGTNATTPVLLRLTNLESVVDMVKGGKPDIVMMAKGMRRYINVFLNSVGGLTKSEIQGKTVQTLFDIPVGVSDNISVAENCDLLYGSTYGFAHTTPAATSDGATTIFVLTLSEEACCGIQSDGGIKVEKLGNLETKDASRVRIKWYPAIMLQKIITCTKLTGIDWDGIVAA